MSTATPEPTAALDPARLLAFLQRLWEDSVVPTLLEYIRIPAKSPAFDPGWRERGELLRAARLMEGWCRSRRIDGLRVEVLSRDGRTPLLLVEHPGHGGEPVLLYGHLDKQPEMMGWAEGLGPWTPVRRGDRLYGRGGADDGYAVFAALTALEALQAQRLPHGRAVVLIEATEESRSPDLPFYMDLLADRLGTPGLVVALDSGCGDYERLWLSTSLRGLVNGVLTVQVLEEGIHSGATGIVPSSFRVLRQLLARLEDERTGEILPRSLQVTIPADRVEQARAVAGVLGENLFRRYPVLPGVRPAVEDPAELVLNFTWRPALAVTGAAGLPAPADAGNVLHAMTALKLSLRLPPTLDAAAAGRALKALFEADPPSGARVTFTPEGAASGWSAPPASPWLEQALRRASLDYFGAPALASGEGGSIPFMTMLNERFPHAQFMVTGLLGPGSNAHGPNEFLHLPTAVRLTASVARVLHDHWQAHTG